MTTETYVGRDLEVMAAADHYHAWILDLCRPYLRGRAAEVGAGTGTFTRLLADTPLTQVTAFEPAENLFRVLQERVSAAPNIEPRNALFPRHGEAEREAFETIFYINVLEHIPDHEAELHSAFEALTPGGRLAVFAPALSWLYGSHDREVGHCRRYHRAGLVQLAQQQGFEVLLARYFDFPGILPWFILFRVFKTRMQGGQVDLYDRWAVPVIRRLEAWAPPPIGKNLLLIAEKPVR